jgi:sterol desaturase/sphingolipid hydroxylase (fatty acid hydroxylase superfamily)
MPPSLSIPIGLFFYSIYYLVLGADLCNPFFIGFNVGYLLYDELHYATHHATWNWKWFQALKKYHMKHHYQNPDEGFGVSSPMWDHVFRSTFKEEKK